MKTIYFANSNSFGPFLNGKTYSEGFIRTAQNHDDELLIYKVSKGLNSKFINHLPKTPAVCINGVINMLPLSNNMV